MAYPPLRTFRFSTTRGLSDPNASHASPVELLGISMGRYLVVLTASTRRAWFQQDEDRLEGSVSGVEDAVIAGLAPERVADAEFPGRPIAGRTELPRGQGDEDGGSRPAGTGRFSGLQPNAPNADFLVVEEGLAETRVERTVMLSTDRDFHNAAAHVTLPLWA